VQDEWWHLSCMPRKFNFRFDFFFATKLKMKNLFVGYMNQCVEKCVRAISSRSHFVAGYFVVGSSRDKIVNFTLNSISSYRRSSTMGFTSFYSTRRNDSIRNDRRRNNPEPKILYRAWPKILRKFSGH
jgi:hypothetical protein